MSPQDSGKIPAARQKNVTTRHITADSVGASSSKSTSGSLLLWQQLDQEQASSSKARAKSGRQNFLVPRRLRGLHKEVHDKLDVKDPSHRRANIAPNLQLVIDGLEVVDDDMEESEVESGSDSSASRAESPLLPFQPEPQIVLKQKAARKLHSVDVSDSDSDSDDTEQISESSSHESLQPIKPHSNEGRPPIRHNDRQMGTSDSEVEMSSMDRIKDAVRPFVLPTLRMHATKQLPFLRRNLAAGFRRRCQSGHIAVYSDDGAVNLCFHYEHIDGIAYKATVNHFCCPLCSIFPKFPTREMLECHLSWDHPEFVYEWHVDTQQAATFYTLKILIPEPTNVEDVESTTEAMHLPENIEGITHSTPQTPRRSLSAYDISILPFVTLSPPPSPEIVTSDNRREGTYDSATPQIGKKEEANDFSSAVSLSRSRSTFSSQQSSVTAQSSKQVTYRQDLPPPNPENPMGPAIRHPFLPISIPEYGGPTVYYSCRPGGPCLYDLLSTLPLKPYGVLSWEVLDREEEIYESDDIKEEYKIMHALWARWIMLNRPQFISNYAKNVMKFVDYYWKFIYLASGWDGLRYWLLMLHTNRFLTVTEVAKILRHYEELTGMSDF
ncbi:hypothetical protein CVT24_004757 [Panaeolus cyanescens]|uniref:Uncharacterized protein n=1 Tax=Panaeolus cyanescens TaxID=181874 RepID=A0A409VC05_9AGAR|nr:hypothetical protein CVT24_004757 [Panaeolus cyanescens]